MSHDATERAKRILIVEDDEGVVRVLGRLFKTLGASVMTAGTAQKALDVLQEDPPDLLVLDLMLPYGSREVCELLGGEDDPREIDTGIRLLQHLRGQEQGREGAPLWVAVITARSELSALSSVAPLVSDGRGRLFIKPFDDLALEAHACQILGLPSELPDALL